MSQDLVSFVLRFVREAGEDQQTRWRGVVKHVQSDTERNFSQFVEALAFMQSYVQETVSEGMDEVTRRAGDMARFNPMAEAARFWGDFMPPYARAMMEAMGEATNYPIGEQGDIKMDFKDNPFQMNLDLWQQFSESYTKNMFAMFEKNLEQSKAFQEQVQSAVNQAVEAQFKMVMSGLETMEKQIDDLSKRMTDLGTAQSNGKKGK